MMKKEFLECGCIKVNGVVIKFCDKHLKETNMEKALKEINLMIANMYKEARKGRII